MALRASWLLTSSKPITIIESAFVSQSSLPVKNEHVRSGFRAISVSNGLGSAVV